LKKEWKRFQMKFKEIKKAIMSRKTFGFKLAEDEKNKLADSIVNVISNNQDSSEEDLTDMISSLPDDINIYVDDGGFIRFTSIDLEELAKIEKEADPEKDNSAEKEVEKFSEDSEGNKFACSLEDGGCFENNSPKVYSLSDKKEAGFYSLAQADSKVDKTGRTKIEVLRQGNFDHYWYGEIVFNRDYFLSVMANFINGSVAREISFDFQHQPEYGAAAWVKKFGIEARRFSDGIARWVLTSDIEYTKMGLESVQEKRFKYFSVEVRDAFTDKETNFLHGPTAMGGGLTNRPYIPGMKVVTTPGSTEGGSANSSSKNSDKYSEPKTKPASEDSGEGVGKMKKLEEKIADLQAKFDAIEDKKSEAAQLYGEQIDALKDAQKMFSEVNAQTEAEIAEKFNEQAKKLSEQDQKMQEMAKVNEKLLAEADEAREERRKSDVELYCKTLAEQNHTPAVVEVVKKHLTANHVIELYKFSEEGAADKSIALKDVIDEILSAIPKEGKIDLGENLKHDATKNPEKTEKDEKVILSDGEEIDLMDEDRIKKNLAKVGVKTK